MDLLIFFPGGGVEYNGGDTSTRELKEGTQATLQITIKHVWRIALFLFHSFTTLAVREFFTGLAVPQISASWVCGRGLANKRIGESEGERKPTQLTVTGTLAEKRTVLSEAAEHLTVKQGQM